MLQVRRTDHQRLAKSHSVFTSDDKFLTLMRMERTKVRTFTVLRVRVRSRILSLTHSRLMQLTSTSGPLHLYVTCKAYGLQLYTVTRSIHATIQDPSVCFFLSTDNAKTQNHFRTRKKFQDSVFVFQTIAEKKRRANQSIRSYNNSNARHTVRSSCQISSCARC